MSKEKTVILALGAAASLLFAPFLVGTLKGKAQEENTMMNGGSNCEMTGEDCHCAKAGKECTCKSGDCKGSCGGEGSKMRCGEGSEEGK
jgi:hypothetical protein